MKSIIYISFKFVVFTLGSFYFLVPVILRFFPSVRRAVLFLAFLRRPFVDLAHPAETYNITGSRNFYVWNGDGINLGAWQLLPRPSPTENHRQPLPDDWEAAIANIDRPVVLYLHGNAFDRTAPHRREIYELFANENYHVIAFDYRGFGDSTGSPSPDGVVADALRMYNWVRDRSKYKQQKVLVWGHSLGTAVATELVKMLPKDEQPIGLVLEAPFNNLDEVIRHHPLTIPFRWLPWFEWVIENPITDQDNAKFRTDQNIQHVHCPVLILHAADDHVIPFELAVKLKKTAEEANVDVQWVEFDGRHKYEHKYICRAPTLPAVLNHFVQKCIDKKNK